MSLTTLPTKTDASLGRLKADRPSPFPRVTDQDFEVDAAEWERNKDSEIANATAIGLGDGTTAGSLEARAALPSSASFFEHSDDFEWKNTDRWSETLGGGGVSPSVMEGSNAAALASGAGAGILLFDSTGAAQAIDFFHTAQPYNSNMGITFRGRFRTLSAFANLTWDVGFSDTARTSYCRMYVNGAGNWVCEADSATGGGPQEQEVTAVAAVVSTWYTLEIVLDDGVDAEFKVNGTTVAFISVAAALPQSGDKFGPFVRVNWLAGNDNLLCDEVEMVGARI